MTTNKLLASGLANLLQLKRVELTRLARLTGSPISGTKKDVAELLLSSLKQPKLFRSDIQSRKDNTPTATCNDGRSAYQILSIDMGIRNLAYCRLLVKRQEDAAIDEASVADTKTKPLGSVCIQTWQRINLSLSEEFTGRKPTPQASADEDIPENAPDMEKAPEVFTPSELSKHALAILRNLVLHAPEGQPDTILIERQRWRNGGGAAILEWTLRVNSLESMLWAGLAVLRDLGVWTGSLHAVDPGAVQRFWVNTGAESKQLQPPAKVPGKAKGTSKEAKASKILVAQRWIRDNKFVEDGDESDVEVKLRPDYEAPTSRLEWGKAAAEMRRRFSQFDVAKSIRNQKGREELVKLKKRDDLADCLLQGVAWVKWEQNRRAIMAGRADLSQAERAGK